MGQTELPPQIPQTPLPVPPVSPPSPVSLPLTQAPQGTVLTHPMAMAPPALSLGLSPTGGFTRCGAGAQQRNTGRHGREDGNGDRDRVGMRLSPTWVGVQHPKAGTDPAPVCPQCRERGEMGQRGGPAAGQGQGSTYSTGSCGRAEAFPAPPGRHTGERKAGEGCLLTAPLPPAQRPRPDSALPYIVLVPHGIELLQLLGPIPGLLLGDICKGKGPEWCTTPPDTKQAPSFWGYKIRPPAPTPRPVSIPGAGGKEGRTPVLGRPGTVPTQRQLEAGIKEDSVESGVLGA